MRETTNYILMSEKMLGKLVRRNRLKTLYLLSGIWFSAMDAVLMVGMYKKMKAQEEDINYYKNELEKAYKREEDLLKKCKES